jgi:hypothetical protein
MPEIAQTSNRPFFALQIHQNIWRLYVCVHYEERVHVSDTARNIPGQLED